MFNTSFEKVDFGDFVWVILQKCYIIFAKENLILIKFNYQKISPKYNINSNLIYANEYICHLVNKIIYEIVFL